MSEEKMISISPNGVEVYALLQVHSKGENAKETEARTDYLHGVARLIKGFLGDPEGFVKKLNEITEVLFDQNMKLPDQFDYEAMIDLIGLVIDVLVEDEELHANAVDYFNEVLAEEASIQSTD